MSSRGDTACAQQCSLGALDWSVNAANAQEAQNKCPASCSFLVDLQANLGGMVVAPRVHMQIRFARFLLLIGSAVALCSACAFDDVAETTPSTGGTESSDQAASGSGGWAGRATGGGAGLVTRDSGNGTRLPDDSGTGARHAAAFGGAGGASAGGNFGDGDLTVLLILDKSGSMASLWDGASRWETAVSSFFAGMEGVESALTVGAILFPEPQGCDVAAISSASQFQFQNGLSFKDSWAGRQSALFPSGSTPLGLAFERADEAIAQARESGLLDQRRFRVLIVTDGEPTCATDERRLLYLTGSWRELGVEVHVMGLPGSEQAAQLLHALAEEGGTTEYVAPRSGGDAEDTFYEAVR